MPRRQSLDARQAVGRWRAAAACAAVAALSLACSACGLVAVEVPDYEQQPGTAALCEDLLAELPEVLDDAVRRDVSGPAGAAAWGQPPIILRCGVAEPDRELGVSLLVVDGVAWYPAPGAGGTFFTTVGREARVEVAVPTDYAPEADVLVDLGPAILQTVPESG